MRVFASTEEKERCQKGKEDLSQASFKYTHFAVAGKSSYEDERHSLRHHHMMISDAEGLMNSKLNAFYRYHTCFMIKQSIVVSALNGRCMARCYVPYILQHMSDTYVCLRT